MTELDEVAVLQKRFESLSARGGSLEEWNDLGNDYFQAGYGELADACWRKAIELTKRKEV